MASSINSSSSFRSFKVPDAAKPESCDEGFVLEEGEAFKFLNFEQLTLIVKECAKIARECISDPYHRLYSAILDSRPGLHSWLAGSYATHELSAMSTDIENFLCEKEGQINPSHTEGLKDCSQKIRHCCEISSIQEGQSIEKKRQEIAQHIAELSVGDSCLLPGSGKEHAMLYEIRRMSQDQYVFTIINTGEDQVGSFARRPFRPLEQLFAFNEHTREFYGNIHFSLFNQYAHKTYTVGAGVLDEKFLEEILFLDNPPKTRDLIGQIDELLIHRGGGIIGYGRLHHEQKRGSCAVKCVTSWLRGELIHRYGEIEGNALYFEFKVYRTRKMLAEFDKLDRETPSLTLQYIYKVKTDEQLDRCIRERQEAAFRVLEKREMKAKKYGDLSRADGQS